MIHWTRQIKEVLSAQESVETGENLGPLEEIEFWRNRCMDLSGISMQLVKQGVKHIESILRLAKSSYLAPFMKLAQQIQVCEWPQGWRLSREWMVVGTVVSWVLSRGGQCNPQQQRPIPPVFGLALGGEHRSGRTQGPRELVETPVSRQIYMEYPPRAQALQSSSENQAYTKQND